MALSLRKRLGKRCGVSDLEGTASDHDGSSDGSSTSQENIKPKLIEKKDEKPIDLEDLSTTPPPPERKSRSSGGKSSRNVSPSQYLLDRYKSRSATAQITKSTAIGSAIQPTSTSVKHRAGKDTAFSERFEEELPPRSSLETAEGQAPIEPLDMLHFGDTSIVEGVEFDMMGRKGKAGEAPSTSTYELPGGQARKTRSQTRRQQRADSINPFIDEKDFMDTDSLVPPSLSIRKKGGEGDTSRTPSISSRPQSTPSPTLIERANHSVPLSKLSPTPDVTGMPTFTFTRSKFKHTTAKDDDDSHPVPVLPPTFNPTINPCHIWISPLTSSSRPSEPWGWPRAWTCCQCADLDPKGHGRVAKTMVEQEVCSRLECGHVRCARGCFVEMDKAFEGPGPFSLYG